jgi:hypothetical protein
LGEDVCAATFTGCEAGIALPIVQLPLTTPVSSHSERSRSQTPASWANHSWTVWQNWQFVWLKNMPGAKGRRLNMVERELVLRLASLLWRLRRATTMETVVRNSG